MGSLVLIANSSGSFSRHSHGTATFGKSLSLFDVPYKLTYRSLNVFCGRLQDIIITLGYHHLKTFKPAYCGATEMICLAAVCQNPSPQHNRWQVYSNLNRNIRQPLMEGIYVPDISPSRSLDTLQLRKSLHNMVNNFPLIGVLRKYR